MARSLSNSALSFCLLSCLSAVFQLSFCLNPRSRNDRNSSLTTDTLVCPELPAVENGFVSTTQMKAARGAELVALYSCVDGHRLGTSFHTRLCINGLWIPSEAPRCEPVTCPKPKIPAEIGAAFYHPGIDTYLDSNEDSYPIGTTMELTCRADYHLSPGDPIKIECLSQGRWSQSIPSCQIDSKESSTLYDKCKAARINGGLVKEYGSSLVLDYYSPGTRVFVACQEGYEIVDPGFTNKCDKNGKWQSKWTECTAKECSQPTGVKNGGFVVRGEENVYTQMYKTGATVTYNCRGGYRLIGPEVRTCQFGKWSSSSPRCVVPSCQEPKQIENGYFGVDPEGPIIHSHHIGTTITYQCQVGYLLLGDSERTCVEHSKWSGNPPVCLKEVYCKAPESLENGGFTKYGKYFNGMQVSYACREGYRLEGEAHRVCHDGTWTPAPPTCQSAHPVSTVAGQALEGGEPQQLLNSGTTTLVVVLTICGTVLALLVVVVVLSLRVCRYRCLHLGACPPGQVPPPPYSSGRWPGGGAATLPSYEEATGPVLPANLHLNFLPPPGDRAPWRLSLQRYSRLREEGRLTPDPEGQGSPGGRSRGSSPDRCTLSTETSISTSRSHSIDSTTSSGQRSMPEGNPLLSANATEEVNRE